MRCRSWPRTNNSTWISLRGVQVRALIIFRPSGRNKGGRRGVRIRETGVSGRPKSVQNLQNFLRALRARTEMNKYIFSAPGSIRSVARKGTQGTNKDGGGKGSQISTKTVTKSPKNSSRAPRAKSSDRTVRRCETAVSGLEKCPAKNY